MPYGCGVLKKEGEKYAYDERGISFIHVACYRICALHISEQAEERAFADSRIYARNGYNSLETIRADFRLPKNTDVENIIKAMKTRFIKQLGAKRLKKLIRFQKKKVWAALSKEAR